MISSVDLCSGDGWSVRDCHCDAGPRDRPFVEQRPYVSVALVSCGTFTYRSTYGTSFLTPGSILLCDAATDFECRHEYGTGDRCVDFRFDGAFIEGLAAAHSLPRLPFSVYRIPMLADRLALSSEILAQARHPDALRLEELALHLAELSLRANASAAKLPCVSYGDVERASAVAQFIEERYTEPLSLAQLAAVAGLSKYHLVRSFRKTAGVTPYQYVLHVRMIEAARRLRSTMLPVTDVATGCGFGDLSEFNRRFRRFFEVSPAAYRKNGYRRASAGSGESESRPSSKPIVRPA
ncbi:MAG: AraC family transcriptional regulator [Candidatus Cybelea sp.]